MPPPIDDVEDENHADLYNIGSTEASEELGDLQQGQTDMMDVDSSPRRSSNGTLSPPGTPSKNTSDLGAPLPFPKHHLNRLRLHDLDRFKDRTEGVQDDIQQGDLESVWNSTATSSRPDRSLPQSSTSVQPAEKSHSKTSRMFKDALERPSSNQDSSLDETTSQKNNPRGRSREHASVSAQKFQQLNSRIAEKDARISSIITENQDLKKRLEAAQVNLLLAQKREAQASEVSETSQKSLQERDRTIAKLGRHVQKLQDAADTTREELDTVIRNQQEASFKQIEPGRWLPTEERKIINNLERLRRDMRSWAKGAATKDMESLNSLDNKESHELFADLSNIVTLVDNRLPPGLPASKASSILLNALLAHSVFSSVFRAPFFFLEPEILNQIYWRAQNSKRYDAEVWRSDTLRILRPSLGNRATEGERGLHKETTDSIVLFAEQQALHFLKGPARHLILNLKPGTTEKIQAIYQEAATLSSSLWTRRSGMRLQILHDLSLSHVVFNVDDPRLVPHPLVQPEDFDRLKGSPFTVVVSPLLVAYGTDEAEDYDGPERVWARAEVWLNSK